MIYAAYLDILNLTDCRNILQEREKESNMEQNMKKRNRIIMAVAALAAVAAIIAGLWLAFRPQGDTYDKKITVEVVYADSTSDTFVIETNQEFLRGACEEINLIHGDESDYGLYIKEVNSVTADYDTDGAYWSVMENGEYSNYGVDSLVIEDGGHYEFVYTVSTW